VWVLGLVGVGVLVGGLECPSRGKWKGERSGGGAYPADDVVMVGEVGFTTLAAVDAVAVEVGVVC
jgi:hypothetical protein